MSLPYARVTVSTHDSPFSIHVRLAFTWKMMWQTAWVLRKILSKWPHYRGHANANTCNHALGTYLYSLMVASSLGLIWMCSTSLHTTHMCECESPGGSHTPWTLSDQAICSDVRRSAELLGVMLPINTLIIMIVSREVSLCLWTYNMYEVPLIPILSSLLTQPSSLISLLH